MAAVRPGAEVGSGAGRFSPRIDEPVRMSTPSSSCQQAHVSVEKAEEFAQCEPCGPEDLYDEDCEMQMGGR